MAIKAKIPTGQNYVRTSAMYQWDYGQTLEIEADNLPSLIEVHFACHGMAEAVVHTCSAVNGVATVAIPDRCLEQASEITAWVYEIEGTAGRTIYSITIPITARTRPARSESVPQTVQDTYTQLITEVNELLEALQSGTVTVGYAAKAGLADKATSADSATTATSANTAGSAVTAANATNDMLGSTIHLTYMKIPKGYTELKVGDKLGFGLYQICAFFDGQAYGSSFIVCLGGCGTYYPLNTYSPVVAANGALWRFAFGQSGLDGYSFMGAEVCTVGNAGFTFSEVEDESTFTVYYEKMS